MTHFLRYTAVTLVLALMINFAVVAGPPLPPGHEYNEDIQPAPIGGGLVVLMLLAGTYAANRSSNSSGKQRSP